MVFRLPTHLESFIPPPSQQSPGNTPWHGALIVSGMRDRNGVQAQEIRVTAVETDGDKHDLWPLRFFTQIIHGRPILREVLAWVRRHNPPICTFMPDRHRDPHINTVNQTTFRSLSRTLFESQTVALCPWGSDELPGAGVIIYPAQNSSALLVGALFLADQFPAFVHGSRSPSTPLSPTDMHSAYPTHYQQQISHRYAPSSRHHNLSQQPMTYPPNNPLEQSNSGHRQDQYRYIMPRSIPPTYPTPTSSSSAETTWPVAVKDEEETAYPAFASSHDYRSVGRGYHQ